jgi:hypothetical protein
MINDEDRAGLRAVLRLVDDAYRCLEDAYTEITIRQIQHAGFAIGAIGAAQSAVKFAGSMIRAATGDPPLKPKRVKT